MYIFVVKTPNVTGLIRLSHLLKCHGNWKKRRQLFNFAGLNVCLIKQQYIWKVALISSYVGVSIAW